MKKKHTGLTAIIPGVATIRHGAAQGTSGPHQHPRGCPCPTLVVAKLEDAASNNAVKQLNFTSCIITNKGHVPNFATHQSIVG